MHMHIVKVDWGYKRPHVGEWGQVWVGARGDGGLAPHNKEGDRSQAAGNAPRYPGLRNAPEAAAPSS